MDDEDGYRSLEAWMGREMAFLFSRLLHLASVRTETGRTVVARRALVRSGRGPHPGGLGVAQGLRNGARGPKFRPKGLPSGPGSHRATLRYLSTEVPYEARAPLKSTYRGGANWGRGWGATCVYK